MTLPIRILGGLAIGFMAIQLVPYGRTHDNPAVVQEPAWDRPETRALAARACFDCHSNETKWPWYSNVAPMSWLVQDHVDEGREVMNFSEWNQAYDEAEEAPEVIEEGEMPMSSYLPLHPEAQLTDLERRALIDGLKRTLGDAPGHSGGDHD